MPEYNFLDSRFKPSIVDVNYSISAISAYISSERMFANHLTTTDSSRELLKYSFLIAGNLVNDGLTINQFRKYYNYIKKLQYDLKGKVTQTNIKLQFLVPKIARSVEKENSRELLLKVIDKCLTNDCLQTEEDINAFIEFFEASLNYFEVLDDEKKVYNKNIQGRRDGRE